MRIAIPPLANDFIDLVKGTSLVFAITLIDVFQVGRQVAATTFEPLIMYTLLAIIYLVMVSALSVLQNLLEKKVSYNVRQIKPIQQRRSGQPSLMLDPQDLL